MASIQGAINSMIGSAGSAIRTVQGIGQSFKQAGQETPAAKSQKTKVAKQISPQEVAAQQAMQSAANEQQAKKSQKRKFSEYLAKMPVSLGSETRKIGDLPPEMQKKFAANYNKSQRRKIMDAMDREANNGKK